MIGAINCHDLWQDWLRINQNTDSTPRIRPNIDDNGDVNPINLDIGNKEGDATVLKNEVTDLLNKEAKEYPDNMSKFKINKENYDKPIKNST